MFRALVIGGSAGSFETVKGIVKAVSLTTEIAIFLCLHRMKQVRTGFLEILEKDAVVPVIEPEDKTYITNRTIYLAPANYHMFIERDHTISLSADAPVNHSRPSIDLCFATAADTYGQNLAGILLSGANRDGSLGMQVLKKHQGFCIIQDPADCSITTMCSSALKLVKPDKVMSSKQIIEFVSLLN